MSGESFQKKKNYFRVSISFSRMPYESFRCLAYVFVCECLAIALALFLYLSFPLFSNG